MERKQLKTSDICFDVYDVSWPVPRERAEGLQHIYIMPKEGGDFLAKRSDK